MHAPGTSPTGVETATRHALGWLVFGNSVGLFLAILLVEPQWQLGELSYGRWVPLHLNSQLYGWTALPLVAWLLQLYEVDACKFRTWGPAAVWAWTAALAFACLLWLKGESSGKIFLDWRGGVTAGVHGGAGDPVGSSLCLLVEPCVRMEPAARSCGTRRSGGAGDGPADDDYGIVTEDLSAGGSNYRRTFGVEFDGIDAAGGGADAAEGRGHQGAGHCDLGHLMVLWLCAGGLRSGGGQGRRAL